MSTEIGRTAEDIAAAYLESQGWEVIIRNWRNKYCEIDIIAASQSRIHIVEVKYRKSDVYGTGFEYITPDKMNRLRKAALVWAATKQYAGDIQIDIISVTGKLSNPDVSIEQNVIEG